ncbi:glutamate racemase [Candidatus Uhrbacteria bacterium]|nr:MAG: glutamate racemase [Candidatus Uhrbacteria bacterium]
MLGIFDSGVGGLTVVKELLRRHPSAGFVYLGDTARTPYGNKSAEMIQRYAIEDARFLVGKGATTILVACNSVSAVAMNELKSEFPSIKFFEVITPAVLSASGKKIGVIGTRATIGSGVYERRLKERDSNIEVISQACPLFVPLVEENWINKPESKRIARTYLEPIRREQVDSLILGCTHYPLLAEVIRASLQKRVKIIDSPAALVDVVEKEAGSEIVNGAQEYYFTDPSKSTDAIATRWLGKTVKGLSANLL